MRQCRRNGICQKQLSPQPGLTAMGSAVTWAKWSFRSSSLVAQGTAKKSGSGTSTAGCSWSSQYMRRMRLRETEPVIQFQGLARVDRDGGTALPATAQVAGRAVGVGFGPSAAAAFAAGVLSGDGAGLGRGEAGEVAEVEIEAAEGRHGWSSR